MGTTGRASRRLWDVSTSGPSTFANRTSVTEVSGFFSAKSATAEVASTMSRSIGVLGGCGRPIDSVKNAGSSWAVP
jgi:hypothetical protein